MMHKTIVTKAVPPHWLINFLKLPILDNVTFEHDSIKMFNIIRTLRGALLMLL